MINMANPFFISLFGPTMDDPPKLGLYKEFLHMKYQRKEDDPRVLGQLIVILWVISIMGV